MEESQQQSIPSSSTRSQKKDLLPVFLIFLLIIIFSVAGNMFLNKRSNKMTEMDAIASPTELQSSSNNQGVTAVTAVDMVSNLPEVKDYLAKNPKGKIANSNETKDTTVWLVHVFQNTGNRQFTFAWYYVDKNTGRITKR